LCKNLLVLAQKRKQTEEEASKELQKTKEKVKKLLGKEINKLLRLKTFCISVCDCALEFRGS
jgi:hypothetical protein